MSIRRALLAILSVLVVGAISSGCAAAQTFADGMNNEQREAMCPASGEPIILGDFTVLARVIEVKNLDGYGDVAVFDRASVQIEEADDTSRAWFQASLDQHDVLTPMYRMCGNTYTIGTVYGTDGSPLGISGLQPGQLIKATGHIRPYNYLTSAVFDRVDVQA